MTPVTAGLLVACSIALLGSPAFGGLDMDFSASAHVAVDDDTDLYFAINSRYFDRDHARVADLGRRYRNPDDLAVLLFMARHSRREVAEIAALRSNGLTWWEVGVRVGVPADVFFVHVARDPGPPYGKAYGHWKKHRHNPRAIALSDVEVRDLVAVRMIHEYYGVSVEVAMNRRAAGGDLRVLMTGEYRQRHGKGHHVAKSQGGGGKGHGKGNKK
jgi:hypothetical protein